MAETLTHNLWKLVARLFFRVQSKQVHLSNHRQAQCNDCVTVENRRFSVRFIKPKYICWHQVNIRKRRLDQFSLTGCFHKRIK